MHLTAMTATTPTFTLTPGTRADHVFPTLTPGQIARIAAHGRVRRVAEGEVLLEPGEQSARIFVVTEGQIEVLRPTGTTEPCRSARMPIGRPTSASTARISSNRARCSSCVPWLKFSRNTSTPASNSARSRSPPELAGPIVATILALRIRRSGLVRARRRSAALLAVEDEDGAEIIDIRQGRAGHDKVAERGKKAVGIIPGKRLFDGDAARGGAVDGVRVNNRARIVLGSVDAVSVAGQRIDAAAAPGIFGQRGGEGQQEFAVAPAAPLAMHRDSRLAA